MLTNWSRRARWRFFLGGAIFFCWITLLGWFVSVGPILVLTAVFAVVFLVLAFVERVRWRREVAAKRAQS